MEKRKLRIDELSVESFTTAPDGAGHGTVFGAEATLPDPCDTGELSCPGTCDFLSCEKPCGSGSPTCVDCGSNTCYGNYTCNGFNTCGFDETCQYPACTAIGTAC